MFHSPATTLTVSPIAADPVRGSLSGHRVECGACGFVATTSLSAPFALREGQDHLRWALAQQGKKRGR